MPSSIDLCLKAVSLAHSLDQLIIMSITKYDCLFNFNNFDAQHFKFCQLNDSKSTKLLLHHIQNVKKKLFPRRGNSHFCFTFFHKINTPCFVF